MLLVDIGNSSISWKIDDIYTTVNINDFDKKNLPRHKQSLISCVANFHKIDAFNNSVVIKNIPYKNINFAYELSQLGSDRYAAIIAGINLFPTQNIIIIDIGTAITLDKIINNNHESIGIIPGLKKLQNTFDFKGMNSKITFENACENMLQIYLKKIIFDNQNCQILITGSHQNLIKITAKNISYHQNLVLDGLQFLQQL